MLLFYVKIKNPTLHLEYSLEYETEAGIVLSGDEVKSIRKSSPSLRSVYCYITKGEIFIRNLSLSHSKKPERDKKLLLHKKQINKFLGYLTQKCYVILPMEMYEKNGFFKILIAAAKHLKKQDKREALKAKDRKRDVDFFTN